MSTMFKPGVKNIESGIFNKPVILKNNQVTLRPIDSGDFEGFSEIAFEPEIWKYIIINISDEAKLKKQLESDIEARKNTQKYTFTIIDNESGKLAGSTSFGSFSFVDKRLEIGWTWYGKPFRGAGLNKATKYLMLQFAFEELGIERVEFKADALNLRSRRALEKIGAEEEGTLKSHTLMHDGRRRDTVFFGMLRNKWPELKSTIFRTCSNEE